MSEFAASEELDEKSNIDLVPKTIEVDIAPVVSSRPTGALVNPEKPNIMLYCGVCSMPPEFCEFGACYDRCKPWIEANCPELGGLSGTLGKMGISDNTNETGESTEKKKRGGGAAAPKKAATFDTRVIIAKVQRQKRKYNTVISGLETIPDLRIKDAAKIFGKKFASGASISDNPQGGKEVIIQGDVSFDVPAVLISEFKVDPTHIYFNDEGSIRPYAL